MHNARLLVSAMAGSAFLACSFATSFDDIEGASLTEIDDASPTTSDSEEIGVQGDAATEGDSAPMPVVPEFVPDEGLYTYTALGTESLSVEWLGQSGASGPRAEGDAFVARVAHVDSSHWTFTADVNPQHIDTLTFEARERALFETYGSQETKWVLPSIGSVAAFNEWTCNVPALLLQRSIDGGTPTVSQACTGRTIVNMADFQVYSIAIKYEYVAEEAITVEATSVPTYHFKQTKSAVGINVDTTPEKSRLTYDWYFRKSDGLPVKQSRETRLRQVVLFGNVDFVESGGWVLSSLTVKPLPTPDAGAAVQDSGIKDAAKGQ